MIDQEIVFFLFNNNGLVVETDTDPALAVVAATQVRNRQLCFFASFLLFPTTLSFGPAAGIVNEEADDNTTNVKNNRNLFNMIWIDFFCFLGDSGSIIQGAYFS